MSFILVELGYLAELLCILFVEFHYSVIYDYAFFDEWIATAELTRELGIIAVHDEGAAAHWKHFSAEDIHWVGLFEIFEVLFALILDII